MFKLRNKKTYVSVTHFNLSPGYVVWCASLVVKVMVGYKTDGYCVGGWVDGVD